MCLCTCRRCSNADAARRRVVRVVSPSFCRIRTHVIAAVDANANNDNDVEIGMDYHGAIRHRAVARRARAVGSFARTIAIFDFRSSRCLQNPLRLTTIIDRRRRRCGTAAVRGRRARRRRVVVCSLEFESIVAAGTQYLLLVTLSETTYARRLRERAKCNATVSLPSMSLERSSVLLRSIDVVCLYGMHDFFCDSCTT